MKRIVCSGLVLFLFISILISLSGCSKEKELRPTASGKTETVTVAAVGDIFLTDEMLEAALQIDGSYDFMPTFSGAFSAISNADLTLGNFEGNFNGAPYGRTTGSYPDELAAALKCGGIDILQTANSFSVYGGMTGLKRTKDVIHTNGMAALGTYIDSDDREASEVQLFEVRSIRIAFISFTKSLNGMSLPDDVSGCVNMLYLDHTTDFEEINTEAIDNAIEHAKEYEPDVIIAALHWGSENIPDIADTQTEIADYMFKKGVDAILGSHSHLVSPVERRSITTEDGVRKDVVLAYGLGDFCDGTPGQTNSAPILKLEFSKAPSGRTTLRGISYQTVVIADNGIPKDLKEGELPPPRFVMYDVDAELALYDDDYYSSISGSMYETFVAKRDALKEKLKLG